MTVVMTTAAVVNGDAGGAGISRFMWATGTGGIATSAECDSAGFAAASMLGTMSPHMPASISWQIQPLFEGHLFATGTVAGLVNATTPLAPVIGGDTNPHAAGVGARGYWHTATIIGRRICRGALYIVPLSAASFDTNGNVNGTSQGVLQGAMDSYLAAMSTAGLIPVVWHRPAKGTFVGGLLADIIAATVGPKPAGLRSRRS